MKKVDIHIHTSLDKGHEINGLPLISMEEMLESMDQRSVTKSVIMTTSQNDEDFSSNYDAQQITSKSDRFYYMATADPESSPYEVLKTEKDKGAIGIGELVYNKEFNSPEIYKILQAAQDLNMPVLFHISPEIGQYYGVYDKKGLPYLEEALADFPDLLFIGHSQGFWCEISQYDKDSAEFRNSYPEGPVKEGRVTDLMRKYPNLYADLSANSGANALMRDKDFGIRFIKEFNDRLFFGTDMFNIDQTFPLDDYLKDLYEEEHISKEDLENIYYRNFERVFGLEV